MADAEPLARAICETCAQLHRPGAPLADVAAANLRLIQLCEHEQAPQACLLIVRHGGQRGMGAEPAQLVSPGEVICAAVDSVEPGRDAGDFRIKLSRTDDAVYGGAAALCAALAHQASSSALARHESAHV